MKPIFQKIKRKPESLTSNDIDHNNDDGAKRLIEKNTKFSEWIQEYTKKVVTLVFILYMIINVYILIMVFVAYKSSGYLQALDTLIMEINSTFRDVIGGYIIKAAVENVVKIAGSIIDRYMEYKSDKHKKELNLDDDTEGDEEFIEDDNA